VGVVLVLRSGEEGQKGRCHSPAAAAVQIPATQASFPVNTGKNPTCNSRSPYRMYCLLIVEPQSIAITNDFGQIQFRLDPVVHGDTRRPEATPVAVVLLCSGGRFTSGGELVVVVDQNRFGLTRFNPVKLRVNGGQGRESTGERYTT
jgi:hypothetical protein